MQNRIHTAILPVAGMGTRMLPATKSVPKELMPVYDRPLIQFAVDEARAAGLRRLILVSHPTKGAIQDYFERDHALRDHLHANDKHDLARQLDSLDPSEDMEIVFVHQDEPLGLGHAVLCAREIAAGDGPVAVMLPDDVIMGTEPAIGEMARVYHPGQGKHMLATQTVAPEEVAKYGICACDRPAVGRQVPVSAVVEKPAPDDAPSDVAIIGRYILGADIFDALAETRPGSGGEIQLTDAIAAAAQNGGISAYRITGTRYDCGHADGLLAATLAFRDGKGASSAAA
ncbi:MAG: UTP--glucose-1-phosphate uridylyltransferase [Pseudomonadota bacterium]